MKWYEIAVTNTSNKPFITRVKAGGKDICLVGYHGDVFAFDAWCPHAGVDISQGWCYNDKLICPYHHFSYDLVTGRGSPGQNDYINTYPVKNKERKALYRYKFSLG